jgi:hypothetical protein
VQHKYLGTYHIRPNSVSMMYLEQVRLNEWLSTPIQATGGEASASGQSGYMRREMRRIGDAQTTTSSLAKNELHAIHQDIYDRLSNNWSS